MINQYFMKSPLFMQCHYIILQPHAANQIRKVSALQHFT